MEEEISLNNDNEIKLKRNENILRLKIVDEDGNDTGNYLEFDLLNPEYLLNYQKLLEEDRKNRTWFRNEITILEKKEDKQGELFSYKEEQMLKIYKEFNQRTKKVYNMFLGENGIEKLLNGRAVSLNTLQEIDRIIEEVIVPKLEANAQKVKDMIVEKYSDKKSSDVIE